MTTKNLTNEVVHRAVVKTWNNNDHGTQWGPMALSEAIDMAADSFHAHRYVEVAGVIVFDWDEVERAAAHAIRDEALAKGRAKS